MVSSLPVAAAGSPTLAAGVGAVIGSMQRLDDTEASVNRLITSADVLLARLDELAGDTRGLAREGLYAAAQGVMSRNVLDSLESFCTEPRPRADCALVRAIAAFVAVLLRARGATRERTPGAGQQRDQLEQSASRLSVLQCGMALQLAAYMSALSVWDTRIEPYGKVDGDGGDGNDGGDGDDGDGGDDGGAETCCNSPILCCDECAWLALRHWCDTMSTVIRAGFASDDILQSAVDILRLVFAHLVSDSVKIGNEGSMRLADAAYGLLAVLAEDMYEFLMLRDASNLVEGFLVAAGMHTTPVSNRALCAILFTAHAEGPRPMLQSVNGIVDAACDFIMTCECPMRRGMLSALLWLCTDCERACISVLSYQQGLRFGGGGGGGGGGGVGGVGGVGGGGGGGGGGCGFGGDGGGRPGSRHMLPFLMELSSRLAASDGVAESSMFVLAVLAHNTPVCFKPLLRTDDVKGFIVRTFIACANEARLHQSGYLKALTTFTRAAITPDPSSCRVQLLRDGCDRSEAVQFAHALATLARTTEAAATVEESSALPRRSGFTWRNAADVVNVLFHSHSTVARPGTSSDSGI